MSKKICEYCKEEHKLDNTGCNNSGDCNSGNCNSGNCNSGYRNSGWFNTNEPKMRFFNKDSDVTYSEFLKGRIIYPDLKICAWVEMNDLPKDEQSESAKQIGGLLKTLTYKEAWKEYWNRASNEDKEWFKNLPNFNETLFEEITGINIKVVNSVEQEAIEILKKAGYKIIKN